MSGRRKKSFVLIKTEERQEEKESERKREKGTNLMTENPNYFLKKEEKVQGKKVQR